jgi:hypothetical protein
MESEEANVPVATPTTQDAPRRVSVGALVGTTIAALVVAGSVGVWSQQARINDLQYGADAAAYQVSELEDEVYSLKGDIEECAEKVGSLREAYTKVSDAIFSAATNDYQGAAWAAEDATEAKDKADTLSCE